MSCQRIRSAPGHPLTPRPPPPQHLPAHRPGNSHPGPKIARPLTAHLVAPSLPLIHPISTPACTAQLTFSGENPPWHTRTNTQPRFRHPVAATHLSHLTSHNPRSEMHAEYPIILDYRLRICARPVLGLAGDREVPSTGLQSPETDRLTLLSWRRTQSQPHLLRPVTRW